MEPGDEANRYEYCAIIIISLSISEQSIYNQHTTFIVVLVIKAGERALSRKIHTQHKNLQTVVHAMEDHKRRQSQAFKFTPPDSKTLSKVYFP